MTSRPTGRNAQGPLHTLSNEELARLERTNRQQPRPMNTTMGDHDTQGDLAAAMALMQQTMNAREQAAQAAAELAAQQQQQQGVPIGEVNLPRKFPTTRSAMNPPPCQIQDFEIKPAFITLVQRKMFNGLPDEILVDHIENFERVCGFTQANGVPPDYIKCTLFPFSLDGKAARWLYSLPTGSLTTWKKVRSAFLRNFYMKAKTAALKNKISTFKQIHDEPFCDAWERFNTYRRE